jgi:photosystem II stability/assembly factor-like uncharacterized protein
MKNIKGKLILPMIALIAFFATGFGEGCNDHAIEQFQLIWKHFVTQSNVVSRVKSSLHTAGKDGGLSRLAWAGGESGVILRTNDGTDWFPQNSGTTNDLNGACGIPPSTTDTTVWAVGDSGTILRTNDGGANWFPQNSGTTINLNSACCVPPSSGDTIVWAVGDSGTILKTTDGGLNWLPQNSGVMESLNDIQCFDRDSAIAVGGFFTAVKTTDGGTNWEFVGIGLHAAQGPSSLNSLFFIDSLTGWVAGGSGSIFKTTNGGSGWKFQTSGTQENLNAVFFASPDSGAAVGNNGTILATTDGGTNWFIDPNVANITTANLYDVFAIPSEETGWVVGDSGIIRISGMPVGVEPEKEFLPEKYSLSQNYPNPFNPNTTIEYEVPRRDHVMLKVYNIAGQEVATLVDETHDAGVYRTTLDPTGLASGVYIYRLRAGAYSEAKKLVLLK